MYIRIKSKPILTHRKPDSFPKPVGFVFCSTYIGAISCRDALQCIFCIMYKYKVSIVRLSEGEAFLAAAFGIWDFKKLEFSIYKEPDPAIRFKLLLFKEKSKRISASIGARAPFFIRKIGGTWDLGPFWGLKTEKGGL